MRTAKSPLRIILLVLLFAGLHQLIFVTARASQEKTKAQSAQPSGTNDGYVGSAACSGCHAGIYQQFSQTSMGRSMSSASAEFLRTVPLPASYFDQKTNRHFEVYEREARLYQTEYGVDGAGQETFRDTQQIDWIIGSGMNGMSAIARRDNYLFQAPLSFYSKPGTWGPSPGYEFADYGFNRPILAGCIFCHSGRPRPVAGTNGRFEDPAFSEMRVGCENCHGPGAAHIQAMKPGAKRPGVKTTLVVNPAKLDPYIADNICMGCHQTGDVRVLKPGKSYQDFRPGTRLDDTLAILLVPPTRESPPQADHVEHYYSMTLSKCYRASGGRLSCITCHDPHVQPSEEEAPAYFNAKCLNCHTKASCTSPSEARRRTTPLDNCIGCHMPQRDIQVISHSSATNHRIVARPDEPFPDITFQQTSAALPDLIRLDPPPPAHNTPLPRLTLLEAYGELSTTRPEYVGSYLNVLKELEQTQPENALVQAALGRRALMSQMYQQAADHLLHAVQLGSTQAIVYADLSQALVKLNRPDEALAPMQKAVESDPFNPVLQKTLVLEYINLKQYANAQTAMEHYLKVFPQDDFMRRMLASVTGKAEAK
jgi:hypothetical protein